MQIKQTSIFHHRYSQQTTLIATFTVRLDERNEHSQEPAKRGTLKINNGSRISITHKNFSS